MNALRRSIRAGTLTGAMTALALPGVALAQRASENAVTNADDAFGTTVGTETTGIYSENDTRGFSPKKAGNVRIDGIYFDQVAQLSGRLRESTAIRVGFAAEDYPFHAPTGIVDHKFRRYPDETGASIALHRNGYWGSIGEFDLRLPLIDDHLALTAGAAYADGRQSDGVTSFTWGLLVRPIIRYEGVEFAPFYQVGFIPRGRPQTLAVVTGAQLPEFPEVRRYLGQTWANAGFRNVNTGGTLKASVTENVSLRAGFFRSGGKRLRSFSDIFVLDQAANQASHLFIADPKQDVHSTSGEAQVAFKLATGDWQHRLIAGYRSRNRYTESGGSAFRIYGQVTYGQINAEPEEDFADEFSPVNASRVRQSSWLLGYVGKVGTLATINLGLQKARYRASVRKGDGTVPPDARDNPWLYNASLGINVTPSLSLYAGSETGLEDSGTAPDNAANAHDQLPSTRTTQYEAGVRWKFHGGQLVVSAFQITKPYFSFDSDDFFVSSANVRHRGIETSLSGHFGKRLSLLAGAVAMQPRVSGAAVVSGDAGSRPTGTPSVYARVDANYRTDIFGGLTPTLSFAYTGARAVSAKPLAALDGKQLMAPAYATLDLGLRQQLKLGKVPASFRFVLSNVFDEATWKIFAPNTISMEERRRFSLSLAADF